MSGYQMEKEMYQLYLWFCKERGYIIERVVEHLKRLGEREIDE